MNNEMWINVLCINYFLLVDVRVVVDKFLNKMFILLF